VVEDEELKGVEEIMKNSCFDPFTSPFFLNSFVRLSLLLLDICLDTFPQSSIFSCPISKDESVLEGSFIIAPSISIAITTSFPNLIF
jgi:hypothetical protein